MTTSPVEKRQLDNDGFVILDAFMDGNLLVSLRDRVNQLFDEEGEAAGAEFKQEPGARRLANLVNKGELFQQVIASQRVLELVRQVLGPAIKLSSLNARSVNPHWHERQPFHADMGALADERGNWVCNAVWMLDDFTTENGAIRAIPGSHQFGSLPQDMLDDPLAQHADEVLLTGRAGTVIVMNAHMWHSGTENRTNKPRTAIHAFYCRRDKPQQQYQKQLLDDDVQRMLAPELRDLLALDDPLNDELSVNVSVRSGFLT